MPLAEFRVAPWLADGQATARAVDSRHGSIHDE